MTSPPRYFHQHWRQTRPFARHLADKLKVAAASGGVPAVNRLLMDLIARPAIAAGLSAQQLLDRNLLSHETILGQTLTQWELDGCELLDFTPSLVEALRHSTPGDMRLSDILGDEPRSLYLHFGPQPDLPLAAGQSVEGLLVMHLPQSGYSRMLLVGRRGPKWMEHGPGEAQMLRFELSTMAQLPFDEAIAAAVQLDIDDVQASRNALSAARTAVLTPDASFDLAVSQQQATAASYTKALQLAGCALAYLAAYPNDAVHDWQPDTPATLRDKALRGGKEGERAGSKLRSIGFRQVKLVGGDFERADELAHGSSGPRSPHWRQGHWRNQPHGPQMSLRKLIWIRPVRVLGRLDTADAQVTR